MKRVYVDMDDTIYDFLGAYNKAKFENPAQKFPQSQWGFFLNLKPLPDAIESFKILQTKYDLWILTRPSFKNINCFSEKAYCIQEHFGYDVLEKLILCGDKSLLKGDYLIDDQSNCGQPDFEGEWIQFGSDKFPNWKVVVEYLMKNDK